jgi:hypothetical protein
MTSCHRAAFFRMWPRGFRALDHRTGWNARDRVSRKCSVFSSVSFEEQAAATATRKCDTH